MTDELAARRAEAIEATRPLAEAMGQIREPFDYAASKLQTYSDLIQGTDDWLEQRRGMITASAIGNLLTTKTLALSSSESAKGLIALLAAERITGVVDPTYVSDDMLRGIEDEPLAVDAYSRHFAPVTTIGFMVRSWGRYRLGYSPDGLVGKDGLIEVKSRRSKKQLLTVVAGEVPAENMAQVQAGLFVSGRKWLDYVSYSAGMHLWTVRVTPDPRWQAAIVNAVESFEAQASGMVETYRLATKGLPMTVRPLTEMVI